LKHMYRFGEVGAFKGRVDFSGGNIAVCHFSAQNNHQNLKHATLNYIRYLADVDLMKWDGQTRIKLRSFLQF
jgi:hypothetical protein